VTPTHKPSLGTAGTGGARAYHWERPT